MTLDSQITSKITEPEKVITGSKSTCMKPPPEFLL